MFEVIMFILIESFWFTLIGGFAILLAMRIVIALRSEYSLKNRLFIILLPASYGLFTYAKEDKLKNAYRIVLTIFVITGALSSLFIIYNQWGFTI